MPCIFVVIKIVFEVIFHVSFVPICLVFFFFFFFLKSNEYLKSILVLKDIIYYFTDKVNIC